MLNNILRLRKEFLEISSFTSHAYWIRHVNIFNYICSSLELLAIRKILVSRHANREWNMGVRWYGISLQLFNSNEWGVELKTRIEISYLPATTYYFVYHINTVALYWEEKSTFLMNENNRIDNPQIKIVKCFGPKAQDEKMRWNITKTTMDVIFNKQKILSYWLGPSRQKK